MEFKQLDIKPEDSWLKRTFWSKHSKKTILYILAGAVAGLIILLLTTEKEITHLTTDEVVKNMLIGGFFGFFITNSPCARNKC